MAVDRNEEPVEKRATKGAGWTVATVLLIILAIFIGYNVYYLLTPG